MTTKPFTLAAGRTTGAENVPWKVGSDGTLNGTGEPAFGNHPHTLRLLFARYQGTNVPVKVAADGTVAISYV